jgi:hypothetical protein
MEWLTGIVAGFLLILTPAGLIIDQVIANRIRTQVQQVEVLAVRVDNVPAHQILEGKIDRVRIATRGLEPIANLRIDTLELDTDPIDFNIRQLSGVNIRQALRKPLQGGIRLLVTATDLNRALASDTVKNTLQNLLNRSLPEQAPKFRIIAATVNFDSRDRPKIQVQLEQGEGTAKETLDLAVEATLQVQAGRSLIISGPQATLNGRKLSRRILDGFVERLNERLDGRSLEKNGFWVRVLQWQLEGGKLEAAGFVRVEPMEPKPKTTASVTQVIGKDASAFALRGRL